MTEKCGNCGHVKSRHQPDCFVQFWKLGKVCDCKEFKPNHSPQRYSSKKVDRLGVRSSNKTCSKNTENTPEDFTNSNNESRDYSSSGTSTLSNKITQEVIIGSARSQDILPVKDVKEFIKELKEEIEYFSQEINDHRINNRWFQLKKLLDLKKKIDKLAGKELT